MRFVPDSVRNIAPSIVLALAVVCLFAACGKQGAASHGETSKNVITLTEASFQSEVLDSSQPVLVDFWAVWCGPCKIIAPIVAELATEFEGRVKVGKVDVDAETALAQKYDISAIPTLLIFKDGKPVDQIVGLQSREELKARLDKVLTTSTAATAQ